MNLENCRVCGQLYPHTLEHFAPTQSKHKTKDQQKASGKCITCYKAERKAYNDSRRPDRTNKVLPAAAERKVWGRYEETPTKEGRIVRFGENWKPQREEKRYTVPGLLGYMSPLGSI